LNSWVKASAFHYFFIWFEAAFRSSSFYQWKAITKKPSLLL